jgi:predicted AAA+ superfamily ATPase
MLQRNLAPDIGRILDAWGKMVFLSGPRQVGKTTLAREILAKRAEGVYFNWDLATDRKRLARDPYFFEKEPLKRREPPLLVYDEIHKYRRWKSYLKGVYDGYHENYRVLVTGSGRLDLFRKGGESLLGRYAPVLLLPLTVGELLKRRPAFQPFRSSLEDPGGAEGSNRKMFERLLRFGGFPEPYLKQDPEFSRVWSATRNQLLIREDIRDATNIRKISLLEMLFHLLEPRVGSPLSINNLREDLEVAFETVREWLEVFSNFYLCFRVPPYSRRLARSLRKESKIYFYDWTEIQSPGVRFENVVAVHLLKACRIWSALGESAMELFYLRDREKREVDFLIVEKRRPLLLVECKTADEQLSPHLLYFQERLEVPVAVQLVLEQGCEKQWGHGKRTQWVVSADRWLGRLP